MQLVRYNPHHALSNRKSDFAGFFDGFFDDFFAPAMGRNLFTDTTVGNGLQVDIFEKDDQLVIEAEMPGVAREDITLDVKGRLLTLGYERKTNEEVKEGQRYRRERRYGKFERTFKLGFAVDAEKVAAKYENGVLRLEIPKPEEEQKREIAIK